MEVPGTPETVFTTIIRPSSWAHWFSIHRAFVHQAPEVLHEGARLVSRVVVLGVENEFEWTVDTFEAPHRIILQGTSRTGVRSEFTFWMRPSAAGTTVTIGGVFTGSHLTTSLAKELENHGREELRRTLEQLAAATASRQG
ncbi:SRPBCC family protein [Nocardia sp. NPDC057663]|uniref:type II toxin-antitoxin system Rv0910 family toxin n=1 Tax=Nocardia sp. NPDC057663 TaxID=3346201 RepID=UPI00366F6861